MWKVGGERVIRSLFGFPHMRTTSIIKILPIRIKQLDEDDLYREYYAKCLQILTKHTANILNTDGSFLAKTPSELINPEKEDNRTAEEITDEIVRKTGIKVI